jgi:hypothetical protein
MSLAQPFQTSLPCPWRSSVAVCRAAANCSFSWSMVRPWAQGLSARSCSRQAAASNAPALAAGGLGRSFMGGLPFRVGSTVASEIDRTVAAVPASARPPDSGRGNGPLGAQQLGERVGVGDGE